MKSPTETWNLATLCRAHHSWKGEHTLEARPKLIEYLERVQPFKDDDDIPPCPECRPDDIHFDDCPVGAV